MKSKRRKKANEDEKADRGVIWKSSGRRKTLSGINIVEEVNSGGIETTKFEEKSEIGDFHNYFAL